MTAVGMPPSARTVACAGEPHGSETLNGAQILNRQKAKKPKE
jgi:hypothetical protein